MDALPSAKSASEGPPAITSTGLRMMGAVFAGVVAGLLLALVYSTKLSAKPITSVVPVRSPSPVAAAPESDVSIEQQQAMQEAAHRAAVERHFVEPRDSGWSSPSENTLKEMLTPLAASNGFGVESVDCRSVSCVAVLRFNSYLAAQKAWPSILNAGNPLGCGTEITLTQPQQGGQKYDFSVVYDCSEKRDHTRSRLNDK